MCSKKYNRAGQQGKTDSCPEKENYTETITNKQTVMSTVIYATHTNSK